MGVQMCDDLLNVFVTQFITIQFMERNVSEALINIIV